MSTDSYDLLCDRALLDGARIAPVFGIFAGIDGWRVGATDLVGGYVSEVWRGDGLDEALSVARVMNQAEALRWV